METSAIIHIGIDPGRGGGIVIIKDDEVEAFSMPTSAVDMADLLLLKIEQGQCYCAVERVLSQPGNGHRQAFIFGESYGIIQGVLGALKIPYRLVSPQSWQKEFGLIAPKGRKETRSQKKGRSKTEAQRLFPHLKLTLKTADAALIAEWARRNRG